jgi:hypothetical protein
MDLIGNLELGFSVALTLKNVLYCFAGTLIGTLIGVLPGIGTPTTIALLLPFTYGLEPTTALIVKSAARIWYRNAVNLGLPVLFCPSFPDTAKEGTEIVIDLEKGAVREVATGVIYQGDAPGEFVVNLYKEGGIKPLMRKKAQAKLENRR